MFGLIGAIRLIWEDAWGKARWRWEKNYSGWLNGGSFGVRWWRTWRLVSHGPEFERNGGLHVSYIYFDASTRADTIDINVTTSHFPFFSIFSSSVTLHLFAVWWTCIKTFNGNMSIFTISCDSYAYTRLAGFLFRMGYSLLPAALELDGKGGLLPTCT